MIELFKGIKVDWLGKRKIFLAISGSIMLLGLVSLVMKKGFEYGVDFKGGTKIQVRFKDKPDIDKIRQLLRPEGVDSIQGVGGVHPNDVLIEFEGAKEEDASVGRGVIINALNKGFPGQFDIQ